MTRRHTRIFFAVPFAFSGQGADHVSVMGLKSFEEPSGSLVHRRIGALDSDGYTRLGASMRHVTAALCRQRRRRGAEALRARVKHLRLPQTEGPARARRRALRRGRNQLGSCVATESRTGI